MSKSTFSILVFCTLFFFSSGRGQILEDTTSSSKNKDSVSSLSILHQFAFSSIGFAIGFLPGGYANMFDHINNREPHGSALFVITAPLLSSLGVDLAYTRFWKKKDGYGSFFGGFLGGVLGGLGGSFLVFEMYEKIKNPSPLLIYAGYWLPTSLMTVLLYHLVGLGLQPYDSPSSSGNIMLLPTITPQYGGASLHIQF